MGTSLGRNGRNTVSRSRLVLRSRTPEADSTFFPFQVRSLRTQLEGQRDDWTRKQQELQRSGGDPSSASYDSSESLSLSLERVSDRN